MIHIPPQRIRKRAVWRGLLAGIVVYLAAFAVFIVVSHFLRPFVWFAFTRERYSVGPIDPNSTEWLVAQAANISFSCLAGAAVARWSPYRSKAPLITFVVVHFALVWLAPRPPTEAALRLALWWLGFPFGLLLGASAYHKAESKRLAVHSQTIESSHTERSGG